jgi:hypothetical protein
LFGIVYLQQSFTCLDIRQDLLDSLDIGIIDQTGFAQIAFPLGRFLGEDMAAEGLAADYFTGSGDLEPFGRSSVCFHFRHGFALLSLINKVF